MLDRGKSHSQDSAKNTWTTWAARLDRCSSPSLGTLSSFLMEAKQKLRASPTRKPFYF